MMRRLPEEGGPRQAPDKRGWVDRQRQSFYIMPGSRRQASQIQDHIVIPRTADIATGGWHSVPPRRTASVAFNEPLARESMMPNCTSSKSLQPPLREGKEGKQKEKKEKKEKGTFYFSDQLRLLPLVGLEK
jgi:hypothetical protein